MMMRVESSPQSLAQKLIARAAGRKEVKVGEIVTCQVDLAMFHDSSGPRRLKPMLEELGARSGPSPARLWICPKFVHLVLQALVLSDEGQRSRETSPGQLGR